MQTAGRYGRSAWMLTGWWEACSGPRLVCYAGPCTHGWSIEVWTTAVWHSVV